MAILKSQIKRTFRDTNRAFRDINPVLASINHDYSNTGRVMKSSSRDLD